MPQLRTNTSQSRCRGKIPERADSRRATRRLSYFLVRSSSIDAARATVDHTHIDPLNELYLMPWRVHRLGTVHFAPPIRARRQRERREALQRSLWHHTETPWRHFRSAELHQPFAYSLCIVFSQYQCRRSDLFRTRAGQGADIAPSSFGLRPSADDANARTKLPVGSVTLCWYRSASKAVNSCWRQL